MFFWRWLDEGEDDNLIERELELTEVRTVERKLYIYIFVYLILLVDLFLLHVEETYAVILIIT